MGSLHFFLGIEVVPYQDGIYLSQVKYAKDILKRTMMHRARAIHMPLSQKGDFHITIGSPVDASDYRSIVGGLPYLTLTRPNLTYAINQVCQFMQAPTTTHWQRVKRILRFLAGIIYFDFASLLDPPYRLLASQMSIGLITTDDLLQAAQIEERGMLDRKERSPEIWKQVAINEAAMAVVAVNFPDLRNIDRQSLLDHITVQLAPRAADELWYGEHQFSTIWAETADNARSAARSFVLGGLSDKHYGLSDFWVADRINDIDSEALRILHLCYDRAKEILHQNRNLMDAVVDILVERKSLTKERFFKLVELHGSLQPMPPSVVDLRSAKRLEFQDTLKNQKEIVSQGHN
ncbi:hypothetical protein T459_30520 [Capsicum annuum]|uniref:Peptidase M41 domain-containing protein n=1 Tax=Capsicum annuum TaxID=4072 RepID=A0A2G2Y8J8_CAPAN|nr:hypothetical protein FXO37_30576 [Capsicum annuum]PHT66095.1 hypothetical protein T459_30520 [Capsicum annuum]